MHIINAMFGRELGGIEQAFVDYCTALASKNKKVTALLHPKAKIADHLLDLKLKNLEIEKINNFGKWDILAVKKLKSFLEEAKPDIIIAHGNRATSLLKKAAKGICPVIGVTHNYSIKNFVNLDGVFTITNELKEKITELGQDEKKTFHIPNMINIEAKAKPPKIQYKKPPVIGTMGRFVKKKGFDDFIKSLKILDNNSIKYKAVIGGNGEEEKNLKQLVKTNKLEKRVDFIGWVESKEDFFKSIDIFCLPSLHEPFGIVLLEAFKYGLPVVTTNTEGPSEIVVDNESAIMVPKNYPEIMAESLKILIKDQKHASHIAAGGFESVKNYDIPEIAKKIQSAIKQVIKEYK